MLPAKTISVNSELPYLLIAVKVNADFAICALLLLKLFPNVPLIAPLEKINVLLLAKRARLFATLVESSKSFL